MNRITHYLRANHFRLVVAAAVIALGTFGVIDPSMAMVGIMLDTVPVDFKALAEATKRALERITAEVRESGQEMSTKQIELQARLLDVEQKLARRGSGGDSGGRYFEAGGADVRALLEASNELAGMAKDKTRRAVIELPGAYFRAAIVSGPGMGFPDQQRGIVAMPKRRLTVRGLLPSVPTSAGSIQYLRETAFTNNAAVVTETAEKPESDIDFNLQTTAVATIAHWFKLSKQVLDDTAQLQQHIDGRLRYGVAMAEEYQLLKGSGTGNNLQGLLTAATAFSGSTSGTKIDVLRRALTQLSDSELEATGIVLHPADWEAIELIKDTTGQYVYGNPGQSATPSLWGLPVVPTNAMTSGDFLVADFPQAALIFDREAARVDISLETEDDFIKNMCRIRGEERLGLAIYRTLALIKGTFS